MPYANGVTKAGKRAQVHSVLLVMFADWLEKQNMHAAFSTNQGQNLNRLHKMRRVELDSSVICTCDNYVMQFAWLQERYLKLLN